MKVFALCGLLIIGFSGCSYAQGVPDDIMINSLRCEAGRIGKKLARDKLPLNQKMVVTWKDTNTTKGIFGGGVKFPWSDFGISGELSREQVRKASSEGLAFNLHPKNASVCNGYKRRIILEGVGAYPCLGEQKYPSLTYAISTKAGSTGCGYTVSLGQKLSGSLKIPVWGLAVGPSGEYGDTTAYEMVVAAPPKKGGD